MEQHHTVLDPLFLLFGQQKIFPRQLLLPIVFGDYNSDKEVHEKEVSQDDREDEENRGKTGLNV